MITSFKIFRDPYYMEWKGFICRKHGLSAMVDDDVANCERGCRRYGIALFDATTA